jgi:hypothetical protein
LYNGLKTDKIKLRRDKRKTCLQICEYLEEHLDKEVTTDELSAELPRPYSRIFESLLTLESMKIIKKKRGSIKDGGPVVGRPTNYFKLYDRDWKLKLGDPIAVSIAVADAPYERLRKALTRLEARYYKRDEYYEGSLPRLDTVEEGFIRTLETLLNQSLMKVNKGKYLLIAIIPKVNKRKRISGYRVKKARQEVNKFIMRKKFNKFIQPPRPILIDDEQESAKVLALMDAVARLPT